MKGRCSPTPTMAPARGSRMRCASLDSTLESVRSRAARATEGRYLPDADRVPIPLAAVRVARTDRPGAGGAARRERYARRADRMRTRGSDGSGNRHAPVIAECRPAVDLGADDRDEDRVADVRSQAPDVVDRLRERRLARGLDLQPEARELPGIPGQGEVPAREPSP